MCGASVWATYTAHDLAALVNHCNGLSESYGHGCRGLRFLELHRARDDGVLCDVCRDCGERWRGWYLSHRPVKRSRRISARGNGSWRNSTGFHLDGQVVAAPAETIRIFDSYSLSV